MFSFFESQCKETEFSLSDLLSDQLYQPEPKKAKVKAFQKYEYENY